jgi:hypothetical protein
MTVNLTNLNWLAIAVAAIAAFLLGGAWYTAMFGKLWVKLHGWSDAEVKAIQARRPPPVFFGTMIACYFIIAVAIAIVAGNIELPGAAAGAALGAVLWLLVTAVKLTDHIAAGTAMGVFFIDTAFHFIYLIGIPAMLAAWTS